MTVIHRYALLFLMTIDYEQITKEGNALRARRDANAAYLFFCVWLSIPIATFIILLKTILF